MRRPYRLSLSAQFWSLHRKLQHYLLMDQAIQFCQAGDLRDGLEFHALSIKRFPGQAACWYNYGVTLHRLGKKDEALACYKRAIERDKTFTLAFVGSGAVSGTTLLRSGCGGN